MARRSGVMWAVSVVLLALSAGAFRFPTQPWKTESASAGAVRLQKTNPRLVPKANTIFTPAIVDAAQHQAEMNGAGVRMDHPQSQIAHAAETVMLSQPERKQPTSTSAQIRTQTRTQSDAPTTVRMQHTSEDSVVEYVDANEASFRFFCVSYVTNISATIFIWVGTSRPSFYTTGGYSAASYWPYLDVVYLWWNSCSEYSYPGFVCLCSGAAAFAYVFYSLGRILFCVGINGNAGSNNANGPSMDRAYAKLKTRKMHKTRARPAAKLIRWSMVYLVSYGSILMVCLAADAEKSKNKAAPAEDLSVQEMFTKRTVAENVGNFRKDARERKLAAMDHDTPDRDQLTGNELARKTDGGVSLLERKFVVMAAATTIGLVDTIFGGGILSSRRMSFTRVAFTANHAETCNCPHGWGVSAAAPGKFLFSQEWKDQEVVEKFNLDQIGLAEKKLAEYAGEHLKISGISPADLEVVNDAVPPKQCEGQKATGKKWIAPHYDSEHSVMTGYHIHGNLCSRELVVNGRKSQIKLNGHHSRLSASSWFWGWATFEGDWKLEHFGWVGFPDLGGMQNMYSQWYSCAECGWGKSHCAESKSKQLEGRSFSDCHDDQSVWLLGEDKSDIEAHLQKPEKGSKMTVKDGTGYLSASRFSFTLLDLESGAHLSFRIRRSGMYSVGGAVSSMYTGVTWFNPYTQTGSLPSAFCSQITKLTMTYPSMVRFYSDQGRTRYTHGVRRIKIDEAICKGEAQAPSQSAADEYMRKYARICNFSDFSDEMTTGKWKDQAVNLPLKVLHETQKEYPSNGEPIKDSKGKPMKLRFFLGKRSKIPFVGKQTYGYVLLCDAAGNLQQVECGADEDYPKCAAGDVGCATEKIATEKKEFLKWREQMDNEQETKKLEQEMTGDYTMGVDPDSKMSQGDLKFFEENDY